MNTCKTNIFLLSYLFQHASSKHKAYTHNSFSRLYCKVASLPRAPLWHWFPTFPLGVLVMPFPASPLLTSRALSLSPPLAFTDDGSSQQPRSVGTRKGEERGGGKVYRLRRWRQEREGESKRMISTRRQTYSMFHLISGNLEVLSCTCIPIYHPPRIETDFT